MKTFINIIIAIVASTIMVSCFNEKKPNYQYFPNMYEPVSYEAYGEYDVFPNNMEAMVPPDHTIARGDTPYEFDNTTEGLALAKAELKNPLEITEENLAAGAQLFTVYCAVCHGDNGDGKGILATREKFLGIPSYADAGRTIVPGGIFHVQTYGLNAMGSYASQVSAKERWQITMHVMDLKAALTGQPGLLETANDSTAVDSTQISEVQNMETETPAKVEPK